MNNTKMFVPDKIKVGYQNRSGTYTGNLAYIIYFDNKGILRKENSWESWRDKKIPPQEFSNEPTEGFVLNKGVGGTRESYGSWNTRNEYIRVYDPRGFEFEISVANLLFILQEASSIKGKGLEGEFVYSWSGTELVLLPVNSVEYNSCKEHTSRQSKKILAKDIKIGFSYLMKNGTNVLYLGKYPYNTDDWTGFSPIGKRHIFLNLDKPNTKNISPYIVDTGFTKLAEAVSLTPLVTFPDELDRFKNSKFFGEITGIEILPIPKPVIKFYRDTFIIMENNLYYRVELYNYRFNVLNDEYSFRKSVGFIPEIKDNKITIPPIESNEKTLHNIDELKFFKINAITTQGTKIEIKV